MAMLCSGSVLLLHYDISWILKTLLAKLPIQLIRDIAGDIVEKVALFDQFDNKKTGRTSHAYRIEYRYGM